MSLTCKYCKKQFKNAGARAVHEKKCSCNPQRYTPKSYTCKYCDKLCVGIEGLHRHEDYCKLNPEGKTQKSTSKQASKCIITCIYCGKELTNNGLKAAHEKICQKNINRVYYDYSNRYNSLSEYQKNNMAWSRGKTKETDERVAKMAKTLTKFYETHPGPFTGKTHTEDEKHRIGENVSTTLKAGYAAGTITPAQGVGRGKYSYIVTPSAKYLMRSTYEFIFALYLLHIKQIEFEVESVRVPAVTPNKYAETFIADFCIGNTIVEIKGIPSGKDKYIKEAFEAAGYNFIELFEDSIIKMKQQLIETGVNVEFLLTQIEEGHKSKQYFTYNL